MDTDASMAADRKLAVTAEFEPLRMALRVRKEQLGLSNATLAELSGISEGLANKVLTIPANKPLGVDCLFRILQALCCQIVLIEDNEQFERIQHRLVRRDERHVRSRLTLPAREAERPVSEISIGEAAAILGRKGGPARRDALSAEQRSEHARRAARARLKSLTPEQRSAAARHASQARWRKHREVPSQENGST
jgi:hypothetical protein